MVEAVTDGTNPGGAEASSGGIYPTINRRMTEVDGSPGEAAEAATEEATDSGRCGLAVHGSAPGLPIVEFEWCGDMPADG